MTFQTKSEKYVLRDTIKTSLIFLCHQKEETQTYYVFLRIIFGICCQKVRENSTQLMTAAVTLAEDSPTPEPTNIAFKYLNIEIQNLF
jgi:hypothetical protein